MKKTIRIILTTYAALWILQGMSAASIFLGIVSGVISDSWGDIAVKTMCAFFFQTALIGCILLFLVIREGMKGMGK